MMLSTTESGRKVKFPVFSAQGKVEAFAEK
jgi:hypothetical protein